MNAALAKVRLSEIKRLRSEVNRLKKENSDLRGEIKRMGDDEQLLKHEEGKELWQFVAMAAFAALCGVIFQFYLFTKL